MFQLPLVAMLAAFLLAQESPVVLDKDSDTVALAFDHQLIGVDGLDVVLDQAEFVFRVNPVESVPLPPPLRVVKDMQPLVKGANVYLVRGLLATIPVGTYDVTVRVRSNTTAWSGESEKLFSEVVQKKPEAPTNLRKHVVGTN